MDRAIELIPLICVRCATPIPAEAEEVAWVCTQCGQGMLLEANYSLAALEVSYSADVQPDAAGKPAWSTQGTISIVHRESYAGGSRDQEDARVYWSQPRSFFIPAYRTSLADLLNQSLGMLLSPPTLNPGPPVRFEPVTLQYEDIRSAVEFIVCAVEAGRKDRLKHFDFNLEISTPSLWILP